MVDGLNRFRNRKKIAVRGKDWLWCSHTAHKEDIIPTTSGETRKTRKYLRKLLFPLSQVFKNSIAKWPNRAARPPIKDIIGYRNTPPTTVTPAKVEELAKHQFGWAESKSITPHHYMHGAVSAFGKRQQSTFWTLNEYLPGETRPKSKWWRATRLDTSVGGGKTPRKLPKTGHSWLGSIKMLCKLMIMCWCWQNILVL